MWIFSSQIKFNSTINRYSYGLTPCKHDPLYLYTYFYFVIFWWYYVTLNGIFARQCASNAVYRPHFALKRIFYSQWSSALFLTVQRGLMGLLFVPFPRCLGYGRPFMLELNGYNRTLASMLKDNNVATMFCGNDSEFLQKNANNLSWLGDIINQSTASRVFVRDLQVIGLHFGIYMDILGCIISFFPLPWRFTNYWIGILILPVRALLSRDTIATQFRNCRWTPPLLSVLTGSFDCNQ